MKLFFEDIDRPGLNTLAVYEKAGGYKSLRKALKMEPEDVLTELQASGVRGRGGAGFAMGKKVSFLPKGSMDKYLVCNADESEPGTFKDRELLQKNPHLLIEGMIIAAWAAGINRSFIYIRGEYVGPLTTEDCRTIVDDLLEGRPPLEAKQLRSRPAADTLPLEEQGS